MFENVVKKLVASESNRNANPPVTIAFLGDSVTQGCFEIYKTGEGSIETVFDTDSAYSNKFLALLRNVFPRAQINVINAGMSGDRAPNGNARADRDVLAYSPDLLVVSYGLNDAQRKEDGLCGYVKALREIFQKAKKKNADVIFMTPNMMNTRVVYDSDKFFVELGENISAIQNGGYMDAYMDAARKTAAECGVTVCDCYAKWKKLHALGVDTTAMLSNRVNHPTRNMHELFASSLFETVFFE